MRTVLITGASSGIGRALALRYAQAGDKVILVARDIEKLTAVAEQCANHQIIIADLNDPEAPQKIYDAVSGPIDILINNAGFGLWGNFALQDFNYIASMIHVNITALAHLTHLFLPDMMQRKQGKIINIGSVYSYMPVALQAVYAATKAFVLSFSLALRDELKNSGLTVTAVCPGMTESAFRTRSGITETEKSSRFMMSAESVADMTYNAAEAGKPILIPGWKNKLFITVVKYMPQKFLLSFVRWVVYTLRRVQPIG